MNPIKSSANIEIIALCIPSAPIRLIREINKELEG